MSATRFDASGESLSFPGKRALKRYFLGASLQGWKNMAAAAAIVLVAFVSWHVYQGAQEEVFQQMLVDGNGERPEAVADAPFLQQALDGSDMPAPLQPAHALALPDSLPETAAPPVQLAERAPAGPDVAGQGIIIEEREDKTEASLHFGALHVASMTMIQATPLPAETERERVQPLPRHEYYWLAYRDRAGMYVEDEEQAYSPLASDAQALLSARDVLAERAERPIAMIEEAASTDVSTLGRYARRGLASINNLLGQPVVIDGETNPQGRKVEFAIGDLIEVSKSRD